MVIDKMIELNYNPNCNHRFLEDVYKASDDNDYLIELFFGS